MKFEDYFIEGTNVLKNKLGITDLDLLINAEGSIVLKKLADFINLNCEFSPTSGYLCFIHKYLFDSIYDFAGKYRGVNVFKQTEFLDYNLISNELDKVIFKYNNLDINKNDKFLVAKVLGEFYRELIYIHPFREGNGRCIREYLREFCLYKYNMTLDYSKIDKKNFLLGILDSSTYPSLLAYEIYNALNESEKELKK